MATVVSRRKNCMAELAAVLGVSTALMATILNTADIVR